MKKGLFNSFFSLLIILVLTFTGCSNVSNVSSEKMPKSTVRSSSDITSEPSPDVTNEISSVTSGEASSIPSVSSTVSTKSKVSSKSTTEPIKLTTSSDNSKPAPEIPLKFTQDISDITADKGTDVSFSVKASGGTAPYTYKWWADGEFAISPENIVGDCTEKLTLKNLMPEQDGSKIYCVVTDSRGKTLTSNKATLTVNFSDKFKVEVQPTDVVIKAYDSETGLGDWLARGFAVTVSGGKTPYVFYLQTSDNGIDGWQDLVDTCQSNPVGRIAIPHDDKNGNIDEHYPKKSCYFRFKIIDDFDNGETIYSDKARLTVE